MRFHGKLLNKLIKYQFCVTKIDNPVVPDMSFIKFENGGACGWDMLSQPHVLLGFIIRYIQILK